MKPSIPRGTRDFGPAEMQKRHYIFNIIKTNFQLFGYVPIETPSMENLSTLTGKYGEEGDQLIFKILNSRIHESKDEKKEALKKEFTTSLSKSYNSELLTEKALRYDLTVPFARYVVMNHHTLVYPFKRYQMQPVWRADKPQKGRYREFYQCDADVIGSNSLISELELLAMMDKSFAELAIPVVIKFNHRKLLSGIAEILNAGDKIIDMTVAIDKLDKIGKDGVINELKGKGFTDDAIAKLEPLMGLSGSNEVKLSALKKFLSPSDSGKKGLEEVEFLLANIHTIGIKHVKIELDITLARGLNYYTGTIFEAKANAGDFTPSILGGGRYDDLTGIFGLKGLSGVGISFGIDRIYDVMEELNLFPNEVSKSSTTKLLITNFGETEQLHGLKWAAHLRAVGIHTELYPDSTKLKKQFEYADKKKIPFVGIIGTHEISNQTIMLKHMQSGLQEELTLEQLVERLK